MRDFALAFGASITAVLIAVVVSLGLILTAYIVADEIDDRPGPRDSFIYRYQNNHRVTIDPIQD
jgi:hypothetical protein